MVFPSAIFVMNASSSFNSPSFSEISFKGIKRSANADPSRS